MLVSSRIFFRQGDVILVKNFLLWTIPSGETLQTNLCSHGEIIHR